MRGIIFGKHGRLFKESGIQAYLNSRAWYKPIRSFSNSALSETERKNLDIVRGAEAETHGEYVQPGDLRFWRDRKIKFDDVYSYSVNDLRIMEAEIEAIHGKAFPSEPLIQQYFNERYWYNPNALYTAAVLTPIERANLKTLKRYEETQKNEGFSPHNIVAYDTKPIPVQELRKLSLYDLRLTRNGLYAMRGRAFKTPWLHDFFASEEWYSPAIDQLTAQLTDNDQRNLVAILAVEKQKHDELSSRVIKADELAGLFVEDLRKLANEIPARHGKVFKDPSLQSYFASMSWYKPKPGYSDRKLSKIEKSNLGTLQAALKQTHVQFMFEEG